MATIGNDLLTLMDWAKRLDPDGKTADIVDVLSQTNMMLDNMVFKEGNLPTGEQTTVSTSYPQSFWRILNQGTPKSKATTVQITEHCANLTARSEVDVDEASLNGNTSTYRLSEADLHMEGMTQEMAATVVYGSAANPEEFIGFAPRYSDLSGPNAQNILNAGGTGGSDYTSIWLANWGPKVFGVFPKGSVAGLQHRDLGEGDAFDSDDNRFRAWMDLYNWKNGLVVKDWREVVRIPNIDVSDLIGQTGTQAESAATAIIKLMSRAIDRLPSRNNGNASFYCNRTVLSNLRIAALDKSNSAVTIEPALNQFGQTIWETRFLGFKVGVTDQITNAETEVS